jgi:hypothetical protein
MKMVMPAGSVLPNKDWNWNWKGTEGKSRRNFRKTKKP